MTDVNAIAKKLAGRFVVIDGPDGAGKGTQIARLMELLAPAGLPILRVHDPGDTRAGDLIRQILLSPNGTELDIACETLLFMASRAQLVAEKIRPALAAGATVICDRFISATCAYQGASGVDIEQVLDVGRFAVGPTWPDLTLILDVPAEIGLERVGLTHGKRLKKDAARTRDSVWQGFLFKDAVADSMEARSLQFHQRVRDIFHQLPGRYPSQVQIIDATPDPDAVHARILEALERVNL
ncbi:MAG: Thymidylate kinase [Phycisphaerae bacterium]|nr:Thymidylate kinase [Phycisphaerae bacterium]